MIQIEFQINYRTHGDEKVYLTGSTPELGNGDKYQSIPMHFNGNGNWSYSIESDQPSVSFQYGYIIRSNGHILREEWGTPRTFKANDTNEYYRLCDHWQPIPPNNPFFSSAFTDCLFARRKGNNSKDQKAFRKSLTMKIFAPTVSPEYTLAILGNDPALGSWDPEKAIPLNSVAFPEWSICINIANCKTSYLEYKFVLIESGTKQLIAWEPGPNRHFNTEMIYLREAIIISGLHFQNPLPDWKGAGVAIPVFSLRTQESFGIGEFSDLKKLADWAAVTRQKIIQILPINDTTMSHTWEDSYPYNANSIFALHPVYLNPEKLGALKNKRRISYFEKKRTELNRLSEIDYEAVSNVKWEYFREIFKQDGEKTLKSEEFLTFFNANKEWLIPYGAFCYLRDKNNTPDFTQWHNYAHFNPRNITNLSCCQSVAYPAIALHYFLQYHLHLQLSDAVSYVHSKGLILKGDIPIGISPNSVEAWKESHYFNMNGQTGAPPDDFAVNGQNWGFPTYNWDAMENDNYQWWTRRFGKMADYFDAYRIDHVLGFFRIWEVPADAVHGLLGHFSPALPLTVEEIRQAGLYFNEKMTHPYINDYVIREIFGEYTEEVTTLYLDRNYNNEWVLKPEYETQKRVEALYKGATDKKSLRIRDGLYALISDVLFVYDPKETDKLHPRISAQFTFAYQALNDHEKWCFNRLYDDFFYHRHNGFWQQQAMKKLPALISSTRMLVCAEDLGMIPSCVPQVIDELQILSLEIQRMPKDHHLEFGLTQHYPYRSVATTSTHDMSTIRGWWEEDQAKTQRYYNFILGKHGAAPHSADSTICENIIENHLGSPAMLVILPLQDWLSIDGKVRRPDANEERINIPANPRHYWRYRMHITLEELIKNQALNRHIAQMINKCGR